MTVAGNGEHLTPETVDREAVSRVARVVQLDSIRNFGLHGWASVDLDEIPEDWTSKAVLGFDTHLRGPSGDEEHFAVQVSFFVAYSNSWQESPDFEPPEEFNPWEDPCDVNLGAGFVLTYVLDPSAEVTNRDFEHFAVFNATFNAWPYWRELVQSLCLRLGIPPLIVPVMRVPNVSELQGTPS